MSVSTGADQRVSLLRRIPVFAGLSDEDLAAVAAVSVARRLDAGTVVFREGDRGDTCYVVRSGTARAIREHPDGRSITLTSIPATSSVSSRCSTMSRGRPRWTRSSRRR